MASWTDITALRPKIKDPLGPTSFVSVATEAARLAVTSPVRQACYFQADTGVYYIHDSDLAAWEARDLFLSDATLGTLIDAYGLLPAAPRAIKSIMAELGQRLYIARTADGAGSTDYQNLSTMKAFYKDLIATFEEEAAIDAGTSSGRYFRMRTHPHVGGGVHF